MANGNSPRDFFSSLYAQPNIIPQTEYNESVTRLVARIGGNTVVGDQALQSLMVNFVLNNAGDISEARKFSAALAGIKQAMIDEVAQSFPNANVDELIGAAREAGYDVAVLRR